MFIGRKPDGTIYGAWTCQQTADDDHPNVEEVADDHPELIAFVALQRKKVEEALNP